MLLPRSIWRRLFGLGSGMGLMVLLLAGQVEAGAHTALTRTNDAFCIAAQYLLADTTQKAQIEIHSDFESFKKFPLKGFALAFSSSMKTCENR